MTDLNAVITRIRKISGYQPYFEAFSDKGGSSPSTMPPSGQGVMMKFPLIAGTSYETKHKLTYTAPYFHNGPVKRLDEALRVMGKTRLNKELADTEVADMVAFPSALDDRFLQQTMPRLPPTPGDLLTENRSRAVPQRCRYTPAKTPVSASSGNIIVGLDISQPTNKRRALTRAV